MWRRDQSIFRLDCVSLSGVMRGLDPIGASLRRIINLSVVIVRACGRSSNHEKSGFGRSVPQRARRGLLDAPLEAGHDNLRGRPGKLKLARKGLDPRIHLLREKVLRRSMDCRVKAGNERGWVQPARKKLYAR